MITSQILRKLAFFYSNTDRSTLEHAGIIQPGSGGDTAWKRFNHDFDVFLIKLDAAKLEALTALLNNYLAPSVALASRSLEAAE